MFLEKYSLKLLAQFPEKIWKRIFKEVATGVFCKKGVLRNFSKFIGKHLCQGLFLDKVVGLTLQHLFVERHRATASIFDSNTGKIEEGCRQSQAFVVLLTDLSKAFDCVNQDLQIAKLHSFDSAF